MIENDINDKKYVGKTMLSIDKRFKEHLYDAPRKRMEHRPLYNAINKYGKEHFYIKLLQEVSDEQAGEMEQFWIQKLNTYKEGYNATLGGDGKPHLDYDKILNLYDNTDKTKKEIAEECQCSTDSVDIIVSAKRENPNWLYRSRAKTGKPIRCIEENLIFISAGQAMEWIISKKIVFNNSKTSRTHIIECANGKRKTCFGYHWEWV